MKKLTLASIAIILSVLASPFAARGDSGILIPRDKAQPDPAILSLEEMEITVRIDNGDARVFIKQIFANHTNRIEEGNYIFALPTGATVSDFAVWDGPTRIPAVVLERKRAEELYTQLKQQAIDPGLLQMGERGSEEASRGSAFSARIVPIPPYGTKRLELEYHEKISVENLKSYFAIPLRPDAYQAQKARHFKINFEFHSAHAVSNFQAAAKAYPLTLDENKPHDVRGHFEGANVSLAEDFVITYNLDSSDADSLRLLTYRNPDSGQPSPTETSPVRSKNEPGFVEAEALLGFGKNQLASTSGEATGEPRTLFVLFDTSLSMQWEKLERSYQALDTLLHTLRPSDRFNLLLFSNQTRAFQPSPVAAEPGNIQQALDFIRASRLRGGTDLQGGLKTALAQCSASGTTNNYLVLLSDGGATRGTVRNGTLENWYSTAWKRLPENRRPRNFILAVGDDANLPLLRSLARLDGVLEHVLSTEPLDFKLNSFLSKIGRNPIEQLRLGVAPESSVDLVYPLQDSTFAGSLAAWVGRYQEPKESVSFSVRGVRDGAPFQMSGKTSLPRVAMDHPQLPRLWARARVDALLAKIDRDGEDQASIDEIIRLARQYKFVTPYTSFLAVPRALLRPRVILPGDPVLRVKTDESIISVIALLPFGATQKLRYLAAEDIWQTRFLVPVDMDDGTYTARLLLRDRAGHTYRESKTFVIASKPPVVRINLDRKRFRRGEVVNLKVNASQTTRTLFARLEGVPAVSLRWDSRAGTNTGKLLVPEQMPPGVYKLTVTAEDFAHNIGTQEVQIEVLP